MSDGKKRLNDIAQAYLKKKAKAPNKAEAEPEDELEKDHENEVSDEAEVPLKGGKKKKK